MNIALIGYGKMGKMIEQAALTLGHNITAIVDPFITGTQISSSITEAALDTTEAAIEFTRPDTAVANILALAERKIPVVVGTTGWQERMNASGIETGMDNVFKAIEKTGSSMLWASNFSIGVNMFYRIAWYAAMLANNFSEYDAGGFETHHNMKMDSPSGTAKVLAEGVLSCFSRKKKIVWDTMNRKPEADEFHFPSLRIGNVPGTHSLFFDSPADTIEITHTARSREGFAYGAVRAAVWLCKNGQKGVFTIDDMMKDLFKE
ncbi:MAG: 4-hydroxy-tetrahydrodipicolinate reductase [Treponema sp.]|nr:4-hydroxy-tetrahydrodipicolinate reductase [Treponema sp.]